MKWDGNSYYTSFVGTTPENLMLFYIDGVSDGEPVDIGNLYQNVCDHTRMTYDEIADYCDGILKEWQKKRLIRIIAPHPDELENAKVRRTSSTFWEAFRRFWVEVNATDILREEE